MLDKAYRIKLVQTVTGMVIVQSDPDQLTAAAGAAAGFAALGGGA